MSTLTLAPAAPKAALQQSFSERYELLMDKWREELLSHAKDPKNRDSAAIVGKAFSNPVRDTTCAGYHGCCLRALITAVNTGYLPSGLFKLSGSLYIAPSPDCLNLPRFH